MPFACATAIAFAQRRLQHRDSSGSSRTTPSGLRVTAVMPLNTDSRTNLVQMSTVMSVLSVAWNPAGRHASSSHSSRGDAAAVELAEDQMVHRGVPDDARLGDDRRDVAGAARGVRRADRAASARATLSTPF